MHVTTDRDGAPFEERAAALATSLRRCGLDACYLRRGGADSLAKLLGRLPAGGSLLAVGREGTSLHAAGGGPPLRLHAGIAAKRLRNAGAAGFQDSLLAACELRAGEVVIDATAGLLGDALVAAHAVGPGGRVVAMESIPLLHAVTSGSPSTLGDARADEALGRVSVLLGDHTALLRSMPDESADVVFFDVMFREPSKAAPAYAGLRSLADHRPLSAEAVRQAVRVARRRVVVMDAAAGEELERLGVPLYHRSQRKRFGVIDRSSPPPLTTATATTTTTPYLGAVVAPAKGHTAARRRRNTERRAAEAAATAAATAVALRELRELQGGDGGGGEEGAALPTAPPQPADSPAQLLAATCVCRDEVREALAQLRRSRKGRREEARVGDGQAAAGAEVCNDLVAAMSCCIRSLVRAVAQLEASTRGVAPGAMCDGGTAAAAPAEAARAAALTFAAEIRAAAASLSVEERAFAACDALRRDLRLSCGLCVSGD